MIIPYWGFIGEYKDEIRSVSGKSCPTGFKKNDNSFNFQTRNYEVEKDDLIDNDPNLWLIMVIGMAVFALPLALIAGIVASIFMPRQTKEWHASEHKSAVLLEAGLEPTVANLKKCPMVNISCGSAYIIATLELASPFWFYLISSSSFPLSPLILSVSSVLSISALLLLAALKLGWFRRKIMFYRLFPFILPASILPLVFENFFALRYPSEEKLCQTAEDLQGFLKNLEKTKNEEQTNA